MWTPPDFFLDAYDPNAAAAPLLRLWLGAGSAAVFAVCCCASALALAIVAVRCRRLHLNLAATLAALLLAAGCSAPHFGVSFSPLAWALAAVLVLLLEAPPQMRALAPVLVLVWALCLDSGTIGAAIVVLHALSKGRDYGAAGFCVLAALLTPHGLSMHFSGARALYSDSLLDGADGQALWTSPWTLSGVSAFAIFALAGCGGLLRASRHDAVRCTVFFALAMADARMAPFFAMLAAPPAMAAFCAWSGIKAERFLLPTHLVPALGAAAALLLLAPSRASSSAGETRLLRILASTGRHRVVCLRASWCDPAVRYDGRLAVLVDGRAGDATPAQRHLQREIAAGKTAFAPALRRAHADAVVAPPEAAVVQILASSPHWRIAARSDRSVLLVDSP